MAAETRITIPTRPANDELVAARRAGVPGPAVYAAAALSLTAAMPHLWVAPEHLMLWWAYGVFFLATALAQGIYAVVLLRRQDTPLLLAGIWGNLSIVVLYVITRTSGIPFGPHEGNVEEAELLDLAATTAELGVILALVMLLGGVSRRRTVNALLLLGVALWALRLTGILN
jgi:hypothetical protein